MARTQINARRNTDGKNIRIPKGRVPRGRAASAAAGRGHVPKGANSKKRRNAGQDNDRGAKRALLRELDIEKATEEAMEADEDEDQEDSSDDISDSGTMPENPDSKPPPEQTSNRSVYNKAFGFPFSFYYTTRHDIPVQRGLTRNPSYVSVEGAATSKA